MFKPDPISLPIQNTLPELHDHLLTHQNCILVASPGSGKTSLVPLSLLQAPWRNGHRIIMLEPRRIAARAAAKQMACLYHETIGQTIGYRTRMEKVASSKTRIEVVTHGLFLRHLLNNPFLDQVAAIIFDEIHERSLESDLCLALCRDLQKNLRPDLRLIAMSATPSLSQLQKILNCQIIENKSRIHPVTIHHRQRDIHAIKDLPKITAAEIENVYYKNQGNILVFLPGVTEIHRTMNILALPDAEVLPLYGELHSTEQDKALRSVSAKDKRRIVLTTSIAETSLTVPGVRIVIDGGFRRAPQLDGDTGLTRLLTRRISRAAADQRAGRAGREAEGIVYRLWTQAMQRSFIPHDSPEILSSELSEFLLICKTWTDLMGTSIKELVFPDFPSNGLLEAASNLLTLLGALNEKGLITDFGKKIIQFGAHPRLASMMLRANSNEEKALAADLAALLEERDPFRKNHDQSCDIQTRLNWLQTLPHNQHDKELWHRIHRIGQEYRKRLKIPLTQKSLGNPAKLLCAAFPDRLAQKRDEIGSFRLAGGGSAYLSQQDILAKEKLLIVANIHTQKKARICLAARMNSDILPDFILNRSRQVENISIDPTNGKVIARKQVKFGRLILQDRNDIAPAEKAYPVLLGYVKNNFYKALNWNEATKQLQSRASWARQYLTEEKIPDLTDDKLEVHIEKWLSPWITQINNLKDLKKIDLKNILEAYLGYDICQKLNRLFPEFIILNHNKFYIDYTQPAPIISAHAQKFYGIKDTPSIAKGQIRLQCCLLSPANRPQAVTSDLKNFWKEGWKDMRKDMKGRYPKHHWPENPMNDE